MNCAELSNRRVLYARVDAAARQAACRSFPILGGVVYEAKTRPTTAEVSAYLDAIENEERRGDCRSLIGLMKSASGCEPVTWGSEHRRIWQLPLPVRQRSRR